MLLKVKDRLLLMYLLGTIKNALVFHWGIIRKMNEDATFSEDDLAALHFESNNGVMKWNPDADTGKEIEFGEVGLSIIRQALQDLGKAKPLPFEWVAFFELFGVDILALQPIEKEQCDG